MSLQKGSAEEGRNSTAFSGGSKLLAWLCLSCETEIFRFLKEAQSQKKDVPNLCSDTNSCHVKEQLQAVECLHATSSESSVKKGRSSVTGIKYLHMAGFLAEFKLNVLSLLLLKRETKHTLRLFVSEKCGRNHIRITPEMRHRVNRKCY